MAQQKGIVKIEGTLDDLTFYKSQDGYLVRTKGGVSAERIYTDPAFARTRENGEEFASAASAGKLFRDTIRSMMLEAADSRVTARLTKGMTEIKNADSTSPRGQRNVGVALAIPGMAVNLVGFNFNINAILGSILFKPISVDMLTGVISINGLVPVNDIAYPTAATHITFSGAFALIDFATYNGQIQYTNSVNLPIDGTSTNVTLTPAAVPAGTGTKILLLKLEFFQMVNAIQYTLKNGAYNALAVVGAA